MNLGGNESKKGILNTDKNPKLLVSVLTVKIVPTKITNANTFGLKTTLKMSEDKTTLETSEEDVDKTTLETSEEDVDQTTLETSVFRPHHTFRDWSIDLFRLHLERHTHHHLSAWHRLKLHSKRE